MKFEFKIIKKTRLEMSDYVNLRSCLEQTNQDSKKVEKKKRRKEIRSQTARKGDATAIKLLQSFSISGFN